MVTAMTFPGHRSKYGNRKITSNGMTFDSEREYRRYCELRLLERAGKLQNLQRQVRFELLPKQVDEAGKVVERAVNYVADFVYTIDGKRIVEDTKGFRTADYKLKKKMMLYFHGIRIKET